MNRFISYFIIFILGFVVCALVLQGLYGPPSSGGTPTMAPILSRGGIGIDKPSNSPIRTAANIVSQYVVNIDTIGRPVREPETDFLGIPFGSQEVVPKGSASGVIYTRDGYIITNNHVVADATQLTVTLHNGTKYAARLVGRDPRSDLAVIKIDAVNLPYARFATNPVQVGDWVIAAGNALGLGPTVSVGVVSAKNRSISAGGTTLEGSIQTDAAINRGNSGGALADVNGSLVGINTAILTGSSDSGSIGIGFAIPSNTAARIAEQLVKNKDHKIVRPYLGVELRPYSEERQIELTNSGEKNVPRSEGVEIADITPGSPAAQARLQPGDIILKINGKPVSGEFKEENGKASISAEIGKMKIGDRVTLEVWHKATGHTGAVTAKLIQAPENFGLPSRQP